MPTAAADQKASTCGGTRFPTRRNLDLQRPTHPATPASGTGTAGPGATVRPPMAVAPASAPLRAGLQAAGRAVDPVLQQLPENTRRLDKIGGHWAPALAARRALALASACPSRQAMHLPEAPVTSSGWVGQPVGSPVGSRT